ncbi:GH32 C-terminal domain-containing protein [Paenibacillus caui]|uniref:GH32 C-terminal domain-containing protein n=1 Tax=Paenibacillus caui TaxID=2873927 RepID=UPI001CA89399|nr:GH32 C-terminal domain-containing protein [Paenibacillus caui]
MGKKVKSGIVMIIFVVFILANSVPTFSASFQPLGNEIIHQWKFDEGTGRNVFDSAKGTTGMLQYVLSSRGKNPEWRPGVNNGALLFDGYSTWLDIAPNEATVPGGSFSIETWIAPRAYEWGDQGYSSVIVNQHNETEKKGYLLGLGRHGYVTFQIGLNDGNWYELWSPAGKIAPKNKWTHVVAVFDQPMSIMRLYLDGDLVATKPVPVNSWYVPAADQPLRIGKHNQATAVTGPFQANMFNGLIDDLTIYNQVVFEPDMEMEMERVRQAHGGQLPSPDLRFNRTIYDGDPYRPQYHFTAPNHWMNEPHAPFYYNGKYHLFYQFNPFGPFWHQIHWGHAVSGDMMHWEDAPIALAPSEEMAARDGVWSGSASFDSNGNPVLFYTAGHDDWTPNQMTGIARPSDLTDVNLQNWNMKAEPVTIQAAGLQTSKGPVMFGQFRDPFVWKEGNTWYQLVGSGVEGVGGTALLYTSSDMENWTYQKELFVGDKSIYPKTGDVWEMPSLTPVTNPATGETKHLFMICPYFTSPSPYAARYTFYWIGHWDAGSLTFTPDHAEPRIFDYGEHLTGAQAFIAPNNRTIVTDIIQDRRSEQEKFDSGWAHGAGLPLQLFLKDSATLGVRPVDETQNARESLLVDLQNVTTQEANNALSSVQSDLLEIEVTLDVSGTRHSGVKVLKAPDVAEETFILYNNDTQTINVDRGRSSLHPSIEKGVQGGPLALQNNKINLRIFVDKSMLEVFAGETKSISVRVFPMLAESKGVEIYGIDGLPHVDSLRVWQMKRTVD